MATATKNRKGGKAIPKVKKAVNPKVLSAEEKRTQNRQAGRAFDTALANVLYGWRTVGNAWAVVRSELEDWKSEAIEHHYRENFDDFLDASGWDVDEILEGWQDEDGNVSDEDWDEAVANAVADFVGEMVPEAIDELLNELAEHDNRELIAA
jgi:hypothetical protein